MESVSEVQAPNVNHISNIDCQVGNISKIAFLIFL